MIELRLANEQDAEMLADISRRAFHTDVDRGNTEGPGGPPGYDDPAWQRRMMAACDYYAILQDGELIGGIIAYATAPCEYEMGRIYIAPEWQGQGLGKQAMALLWPLFPEARVWRLDTPTWNVRTRRFYAGQGFVETVVTEDGSVLFERQMASE
jgi:GNAT superfamily N-acetyltransferase